MSVSIEQFNAMQAQLAQMTAMFQKLSASVPVAAPSGKSGKNKKERDPDAPKRAPSAWALFTGALTPRVRALYTTVCGEEKVPQGFPMRVCGLLKERGEMTETLDSQIISAISYLRANPDHKSKTQSGRASVSGADDDAASFVTASGDGDAPAKKRGGRPKGSKNKPKADAAVAGAGASAPAAEPKKRKSRFDSMTPEEAAAEKAKIAARLKAGREAKKASSTGGSVASDAASVVSGAASDAAPVAAAAAPKKLPTVMVKGHRYFHDATSGGLWHRNDDGTYGEWAGRFDKSSKSIDTSAEEPLEWIKELA